MNSEAHDYRSKLSDVMERLVLIDEAVALWASARPTSEAVARQANLYQDHDRHAEAVILLEHGGSEM